MYESQGFPTRVDLSIPKRKSRNLRPIRKSARRCRCLNMRIGIQSFFLFCFEFLKNVFEAKYFFVITLFFYVKNIQAVFSYFVTSFVILSTVFFWINMKISIFIIACSFIGKSFYLLKARLNKNF